MRSERFDFPNAKGEKLAAVLDLPLGEPAAYALFAHCFTCGKDILAAKRIAERLSVHGIATLRFDFTGLGASQGEFANTHFSSNVADLVAAADHLRKMKQAPAILIGHSLGGAAVLAAAHKIAEARAVVTIAAPFDPSHVDRPVQGTGRGDRRAGRSAGGACRPPVHHQAPIPRRHRRAAHHGMSGDAAQGAADFPFADRRHRRYRQRRRRFSCMPSIRKASSRSTAPTIC